MSFKSGFESRERVAVLTQQVAVSSKSWAWQCWTIVWRMMSVEMACHCLFWLYALKVHRNNVKTSPLLHRMNEGYLFWPSCLVRLIPLSRVPTGTVVEHIALLLLFFVARTFRCSLLPCVEIPCSSVYVCVCVQLWRWLRLRIWSVPVLMAFVLAWAVAPSVSPKRVSGS